MKRAFLLGLTFAASSIITVSAHAADYGQLDSRIDFCARTAIESGVDSWMTSKNGNGTLQNRPSSTHYGPMYTALQSCGVIPQGDVPGVMEISGYFRRSMVFNDTAYVSVKLPKGQSVTYELAKDGDHYSVSKIDAVEFPEHLSAKPDVTKEIYPEPASTDDRVANATAFRAACVDANQAALESAHAVKLGDDKPLFTRMSKNAAPCGGDRLANIDKYLANLSGSNATAARQPGATIQHSN